MKPSRTSAPYGSAVQSRPGGTTSPCALSAITGPAPLPKRTRTTRFVQLTMPFALHAVRRAPRAARRRSPSPPAAAPRAPRAARSRPADCRTARARVRRGSASSSARCAARKSWIVVYASANVSSGSGGAKCEDEAREHARAGGDVGERDRLGRIVADAAVAADEQHADRRDVDDRHAVVAGARRQVMHAHAFAVRSPPRTAAACAGAHGAVFASHSGATARSTLRRCAIAANSRAHRRRPPPRRSSVGARTSSEKRALPGITFIAPGDASMRPDRRRRRPAAPRAMRSTASTHSAAAASASRRSPIGTVPAWPAMPASFDVEAIAAVDRGDHADRQVDRIRAPVPARCAARRTRAPVRAAARRWRSRAGRARTRRARRAA